MWAHLASSVWHAQYVVLAKVAVGAEDDDLEHQRQAGQAAPVNRQAQCTKEVKTRGGKQVFVCCPSCIVSTSVTVFAGSESYPLVVLFKQ